MTVSGKCSQLRKRLLFPPQLLSGLAVTKAALPDPLTPCTREQVLRDLAHDFQQALARRGRGPFVLSGLPLWADRQALHTTLGHCLQLAEGPHVRQWYTVLDELLPRYAPLFAEVQQAHNWVRDIAALLNQPLPTATQPGVGGNTVAVDLAHYLGHLADLTAFGPWLTQFRTALFQLSDRYWAGLFYCYDMVGLPATNNAHESLFGQTKRQLRRLPTAKPSFSGVIAGGINGMPSCSNALRTGPKLSLIVNVRVFP